MKEVLREELAQLLNEYAADEEFRIKNNYVAGLSIYSFIDWLNN